MTMKKLGEYRWYKDEIDRIVERLGRISGNPLSIVSDAVSGSTTSAPYIGAVVKVSGLGGKHKPTEARLKRMLRVRVAQAQKAVLEIEDFLATVTDVDMRLIIEYRFIDGLPWKEVSGKLYGQADQSTARKAISRYLRRRKQKCPPCPIASVL